MSNKIPYKQIKLLCKENGYGEVKNIYKKDDGLFYCHTRNKPTRIICVRLSNPFKIENSYCEVLY